MNIAEIRRLEAEATPGPWVSTGRYIGTPNHQSAVGECRDINGNWTDAAPTAANAALIVAMRNALPDLLRKAEAFDRIVDQGGEPHGGVDVG